MARWGKESKTYDAVVAVLPRDPDAVFWGYEVMQATGIPSGTVYPVLHRMEAASLVRSTWVGRRRCYSVTELGRKEWFS